MNNTNSKFTGGLLGQIGISLAQFLIILLTLGIGLPWAVCLKQRWETNHTIIEGKKLKFTGTGLGLFGTWIRIFFLSLVTLGIYSFWGWIKVKKWVIANTVFE